MSFRWSSDIQTRQRVRLHGDTRDHDHILFWFLQKIKDGISSTVFVLLTLVCTCSVRQMCESGSRKTRHDQTSEANSCRIYTLAKHRLERCPTTCQVGSRSGCDPSDDSISGVSYKIPETTSNRDNDSNQDQYRWFPPFLVGKQTVQGESSCCN